MGGRIAAVHSGAAGQGGAWQDGTPTDWFAQDATVQRALQSIEDNCPTDFLGNPKKKGILSTPMGEQSWRSICGLSAVHRRFIRGKRSALHACPLTSVQTPICLCNPFSCMACGGIPDFKDADARENAMWNFMVQQLNHKTNRQCNVE